MSGLGLIHFGFLAAAGAVAVPILIHLLLRPRAHDMNIGTLRFLKVVLKESTRRRRIRRWFLLALRAAAVLLLALLFARPYYVQPDRMGQEREVILLIDQSASMRAVQGRQTLFARAQGEAESLLDKLPEETAVHLAYFDGQGVQPAPDVRIDHRRQPGYAGTDFGLALCWARDLMLRSSRPHRTVYLITDLDRSGLQSSDCEGFPADVDVQVVEVGKQLLSNLSIETAEASQSVPRPQQPIVVSAGVLNAGLFSVEEVQVRLSLEGPAAKQLDQTQTISVEPSCRQFARFPLAIDRPGLFKGFVEVVSDEEFSLDNRRWLAIDARLPDRLLLVDGEPGRTVYVNETYYLETALRLTLPDKGQSRTAYDPEYLAFRGGTTLPELSDYRAVVLCNVARLDEPEIARLRVFVSSGGSLLVFTGTQVEATDYGPVYQAGLLPAEVVGPGETGPFRFHTWDQEHPVFDPFSDPQQGDLRRIVFKRLTRVKPKPGAKVLAATSTGDPVLLERRLGRGTVLLFTSTADSDWSDWPKGRLYVPLVHQMLGYLTDRLDQNRRIHHEAAGRTSAEKPGVSESDGKVFVRNAAAIESQIDRCTEEELRDNFQLPAGDPATRARPAGSLAVAPRAERPDELWRYVIWMLLIVLVAEVFLANRTRG